MIKSKKHIYVLLSTLVVSTFLVTFNILDFRTLPQSIEERSSRYRSISLENTVVEVNKSSGLSEDHMTGKTTHGEISIYNTLTSETAESTHEIVMQHEQDVKLSNPFTTVAPDMNEETLQYHEPKYLLDNGIQSYNPFNTKAALLLSEVILSDSEPDLVETANVIFTHTPVPEVHHVNFPAIVGKQELVYAHITPTEPCSDCIIKFQHDISADIFILLLTDLPSDVTKTIFITPEDGWITGQYSLELHNPVGEKYLIGKNSLLISGVTENNQVDFPNQYFINYLINNGFASRKVR